MNRMSHSESVNRAIEYSLNPFYDIQTVFRRRYLQCFGIVQPLHKDFGIDKIMAFVFGVHARARIVRWGPFRSILQVPR